ncbi:hypothetical protein ASF84_23540 [Pseudomonas sp. Leaf127]|uniref:hypothetical protein n=1 Tax=Pseudomonas sp. Leaf127 TaxID=1736267 RepID=UPI0007029AFA|nr:hypothetical protein [Pseudomonas sp. Leaf127]KQQ49276.1 hypothetical protein ASF84_23540 [Pseudomonas sp. Leaf127]
MASQDKQQKRAQRAKIKAKQNRSGRKPQTPVHSLFASPLVDNPFDDVKIDLSTFDFKDLVENGFDPADFEDLFEAMHAAEAISQLALCAVFIQYPVLEMVLSEEDGEQATDFMMGLLITYRALFHNEDEDTALEWIETDAFQNDYQKATDLLVMRNESQRRGR